MKKIKLEMNRYELIENYKDCFDLEIVQSFYTDYFYDYDYILGDFSYGRLRLKGFYNSNNKKVKEYNNYKTIKDYLEKYCATECAYFLLKKEKNLDK